MVQESLGLGLGSATCRWTTLLFLLLVTLQFGMEDVKDCKDERDIIKIAQKRNPDWLYIVGDSSMRMFSAALVERLNGTLQDTMFGSYRVHDKGGCESADDGHVGMGCTRELIDWMNQHRVTYTFKTVARQKTVALDHLISSSQVPDMFLLATGAWDIYKNHNIDDAINDTWSWVEDMTSSYPNAKFAICTLISCWPDFKERAMSYNKRLRSLIQSRNHQEDQHPIYLLDREHSTVNVTNRTLCEGFHAYESIVQSYVAEIWEHFLQW